MDHFKQQSSEFLPNDGEDGETLLKSSLQLLDRMESKDLPTILFLSINPVQGKTGTWQDEPDPVTKMRNVFKKALMQKSTSDLRDFMKQRILQLRSYCYEDTSNTRNILEDNFNSELDVLEEEEEDILRFYEVLEHFNIFAPEDIRKSLDKIITSKKIPVKNQDGSLKKILISSDSKVLMAICKQLGEQQVALMYQMLNDEEDSDFQEVKDRLRMDFNPDDMLNVVGMKDVAFYHLILVLKQGGLLNRLHTHALSNIFNKMKDCDVPDGLEDLPEEFDPLEQLCRYPMASTPPGLCIIFNMVVDREGSELDNKKVRTLFEEKFKYDIIERLNPTKDTIDDIILNLKRERNKFYDSLVVVFMAHGNYTGLKVKKDSSKDSGYTMIHTRRDLIQPITKIEWLAKKPKLFFFQSCLKKSSPAQESDQEEDSQSLLKLPTDPEWHNKYQGRIDLQDLNPFTDTLVSFATKWDEPAKRGKTRGSRYINTLVDQLHKYGHRENIHNVLCRVHYNTNTIKSGQFRQAPYFESSLQKDFIFPTGN